MDQNSKEIRRQRRIKHDEMKIMKMQQRLYTLGGRSTFHGIDVLLEAKPGWSRRLTILILITMCVACFFTVSDLIAGFINMPISTVINYGQKNFEFPTVNICPDSPMSIERLNRYPDLRKKYLQIADYWIAKASGDNSKWPPTNGDWRIRAKRTFRPHFLYNRTRLMWKWSDYFVSCEYGGTPCNIDEVSVDIPLGVMSHANTLLLGTEGVAKLNVVPRGLLKAVSSNVEENDLPSMWFNEKPIIQEENTVPRNWSTGRVILIDHPSKYICFQVHQRLSTLFRPCRQAIAHHKYLQMATFFASGGTLWRYYQLGYTHSNCVAQMRQLVMLRQCECLSEDYLVPTQMAGEFVENGFCHSPNKKYKSGTEEFMRRIACHDRVAALPREKIVEMTIPAVYETAILVQLTLELERLWNCPKFCQELVYQPEIIQHQTILNSIIVKGEKKQPEENVSSEDLAVITVYASEASVPIMSEGEQMSIFNLIASLGGAFGLFLGLSGVTVFEILEALCVIIYTLPAVCRMLGRRIAKCATERKRRKQEISSKLIHGTENTH
ncbi:unnamed protein product [Trichobilharzia szidati]|nr:unnamed protein product [Trichobilharzia szidati]